MNDATESGCGLIAFLAMILTVVFATLFVLNKIEEADEILTDHVGKRLIIDRDTLTIVDYGLMGPTFTLSNGLKIDSVFLKSHPIIH